MATLEPATKGLQSYFLQSRFGLARIQSSQGLCWLKDLQEALAIERGKKRSRGPFIKALSTRVGELEMRKAILDEIDVLKFGNPIEKTKAADYYLPLADYIKWLLEEPTAGGKRAEEISLDLVRTRLFNCSESLVTCYAVSGTVYVGIRKIQTSGKAAA